MMPRHLITANRPAPRRIILLAADGVSVERALAEPPVGQLIEELRQLRQEHPGRSLAAEWLKGDKWVRWITTLEATKREGPITTT